MRVTHHHISALDDFLGCSSIFGLNISPPTNDMLLRLTALASLASSSAALVAFKPTLGLQSRATQAIASRSSTLSAQLVAGWASAVDEVGQTYYYNTKTGATSWVWPPE